MKIPDYKVPEGTQKVDAVFIFKGFNDDPPPKYPSWRYHKIENPVLVHNTEEDKEWAVKGWNEPEDIICASKQLINWVWDLEDMSARQLVCFAKDEYGIDLPLEAGQERLFKAVCQLSKDSPKNEGRIVMMAHTIRMNYDETL